MLRVTRESLDVPPLNTTRPTDQVDCLLIAAASFDRLLAVHPAVARRWLSSVASCLAAAQSRLLGPLAPHHARPKRSETTSKLSALALKSAFDLAEQALSACSAC
jgi:CRP/FNR family transcriptional regulator, cAMP and macrophage regulator